MPRPHTNVFVRIPRMPLPYYSTARPLLSPVSTVDVYFFLPPLIWYPTLIPPVVGVGPPTEIPLPIYGLFSWLTIASPSPVVIPQPLVSPMTRRPVASSASPWYDVVIPHVFHPPPSLLHPTVPRTLIRTLGLPVSPPCRTGPITGCLHPYFVSAFHTFTIVTVTFQYSDTPMASHCLYNQEFLQGIVIVSPIPPGGRTIYHTGWTSARPPYDAASRPLSAVSYPPPGCIFH